MAWTAEDVEKALTTIKNKAATDASFRARMLADPHKAIEEATGHKVPASLKIKVVESDPAYHMTFVLPEMAPEELSDEALSKVAGGVSVALIVAVCGAAVDVGPCAPQICGAEAEAR